MTRRLPVTWLSSTLGRLKTFLLAHRAGRWLRLRRHCRQQP